MKCPYCESEVEKMDPIDQAHAEVAEAVHRERVDMHKEKLKAKSPWFPWRLKIERV